MTTQDTDTIRPTGRTDRRSGWPTLAAAGGFVVLYLATDFVAPNFASSSPRCLPTRLGTRGTGSPTTGWLRC